MRNITEGEAMLGQAQLLGLHHVVVDLETTRFLIVDIGKARKPVLPKDGTKRRRGRRKKEDALRVGLTPPAETEPLEE